MHKRINTRVQSARARAQLSPRTVQWLIKADRAIPLKLETVSLILRRSRITEIFTKDAGSPAEMRCDKDGPRETRRFRRRSSREMATANFANLHAAASLGCRAPSSTRTAIRPFPVCPNTNTFSFNNEQSVVDCYHLWEHRGTS